MVVILAYFAHKVKWNFDAAEIRYRNVRTTIPAVIVDKHSQRTYLAAMKAILASTGLAEVEGAVELADYQKDGPGELLRLYDDRIIGPVFDSRFEMDKKLVCPHCGRMIGLGYIYKKENRPAWRLFQGTIEAKKANE
jgi:hypothetical protein